MCYRLYSVIFPVLLVTLAGCQRLPERPDGMPELVRCTIQVTFGGERLQGVGILLLPADAQVSHWQSGGLTDAEGKAEMKTAAHYTGVVPGEYFVILQKFAEPELRADGMPLPAKPLIPIKYSKAETAEKIVISKEQTLYVLELEGLPPG